MICTGNRTRAKESVTISGAVVADWTTIFDAAGELERVLIRLNRALNDVSRGQ